MFSLPDREYSAFIFDCDGTLADSMPVHYEAWLAALRKHGVPSIFSWQVFMSRAGKTLEVTVEELNAEFGLSLDRVAVACDQRSEYRARIASIKPIASVVAFARERAERGFPVSVASGGDPATVEQTLRAIGVHELFPIVVTASEVLHGKPAPDLFLLAAARMAVAPEACLVFEDSGLGILAAQRAGMGSVLVSSRV
jgi:beta-phosphoglucomutase-like phosphatase (HAD superfamily)